MHNIKQEILDNSILIEGTKKISQHIYNEGLNKDNLENEKKRFLKELVKDFTELINIKEHYPEDDIQDIDLYADFIIINRKDLEKIF